MEAKERTINRLKAACKAAQVALDMFDNKEFEALDADVKDALYKISDGQFMLADQIRIAEEQLRFELENE